MISSSKYMKTGEIKPQGYYPHMNLRNQPAGVSTHKGQRYFSQAGSKSKYENGDFLKKK